MAERFINVGGVPINFGTFFDSAEEADEWLPFDENGEELEIYDYRSPDQFAEWCLWRSRWEDDGGTLEKSSGDLTAGVPEALEEVRGTPAGANPVIDTELTEGA